MTRKEYLKSYYEKNKVRISKFYEKHHRDIRSKVIAGYGGKCVCCEDTNVEFLSIDHKNNDGAEKRRLGERAYTLYRKLIKEGFPKEDYQLMCHNCNFSKGHYGYCPHQVSEYSDIVDGLGGLR